MIYRMAFAETADKQFQKLDNFTQRQIAKYIDKHIDGSENPRLQGVALKGKWGGLWRYEVGKYRLICDIQDDVCVVLAIKIGHRKDVYR
jgi:mRNA interferase RelE/StbE